ncbi:hypothetical protein BGW36DRAFT_364108 [Talaromyces proteolyticus]|uniref:Uncharacterized protein n=1 Tax=Talaromyces proteolyticus TaxID=1131652 RepID=A0AAD4KFK7_9EURO|nr:uncharacterized protein BGW36DRAFT_364108 [Talaromyces proteolyticus]KAH8690536.1 hypothetical protein BGW36DRAFT_364108 [Talaromyces proteolyticus]
MFDRQEHTDGLQDVRLELLPGENLDAYDSSSTHKHKDHVSTQTHPISTLRDSNPNSAPYEYLQNVKETRAPSDAHTTAWELLSEWYIWEVLAVIVSAGTLVAMLAILGAFNKKPQPGWKLMSLNSLISWLSTISKGCILFAINETLGQLKWVWFTQKTRPVPNLRSFDTASRGFWGSAQLIWELRGRHFAALGGLAVILALALDPFAQNLVRYYEQMVVDPSQTALLANTTIYKTRGPYMNGGLLYVDPVLKANVYNSLFNTDKQVPWSVAQYTCSSNNCTWGPVASLEYRALCANVTDSLNITAKELTSGGYQGAVNISLGLPNSTIGAWFLLNMTVGVAVTTSPVHPQNALVYKNGTTVIQYIAPYGITSLEGDKFAIPGFTTSTSWLATECSLEPMVRSFNASVNNSAYSETTIATWSNQDTQVVNGTSVRALQPPWGSEMGTQPNQTFQIYSESLASINEFLTELFTGNAYGDNTGMGRLLFRTDSSQIYAALDVIQTLTMGNITGCGFEAAEKLSCSMNNVAAAISKTLRDSEFISADSNPSQANMTSGHAMSLVTHVTVRWEWIVLSILVWLLGTIMLIGTIWKTRQEHAPKWKNDPLPLLFLYQAEQKGLLAEQDVFKHPHGLKFRLHGNSNVTDEGGGNAVKSRTYTFNA